MLFCGSVFPLEPRGLTDLALATGSSVAVAIRIWQDNQVTVHAVRNMVVAEVLIDSRALLPGKLRCPVSHKLRRNMQRPRLR
jgi:hypothetical protein